MLSNDLRIARVEVFRLNIPLIDPFVISLETITHAHNLLVRLTANNGLIGWGECSPYRRIAGETQDSGFAVAPLLARALEDRHPWAIAECHLAMDQVIRGNRCIKSTFDLALYDLAARGAQLPLYAWLGGAPHPLRTDMTVGLGEPNQMAQAARRYQEAGFYAIKLKLGGDTATDVARVQAVRAAIGPDWPLRVDANQGWNLPTARRTLTALAAYNIEYCEEPLPSWQYQDLPLLRQQSPIPIMADESCFDHHDAIRLIRMQACDFFNIKLSKAGGIHNATKIAHIAAGAGMDCQVGCFSESRVGITALAHFALAHPNITQYDMDAPLMLAEDPVVGGATFQPGGIVEVSSTPGLGLDLPADYLATLESFTLG